jgi:hypothetical protein
MEELILARVQAMEELILARAQAMEELILARVQAMEELILARVQMSECVKQPYSPLTLTSAFCCKILKCKQLIN